MTIGRPTFRVEPDEAQHLRCTSVDIVAFGENLKVGISHDTWRPTLFSHVQHQIDHSLLRGITNDVSSLLNRANANGEIPIATMNELKRAGQRLFDELLPAVVKKELKHGDGSLRLTLDDSLIYLPWELLHTGDNFLCLQYQMGRLVRTEQIPLGAPRRMNAPESRTMLVVCDPRNDLIVSYYEGVTIRDRFDGDPDRLKIDLRSSEVDSNYIKDNIRDYDIVHYAGHSDLDHNDIVRGGWRLSDGRLTTDDILRIAGGRSFPAMVFANACRSGHFSEVDVNDHAKGVYGIANAFLLGGVQHFIGSLWDVSDESSCEFALVFYRYLLKGSSVGESLFQARDALRRQYGVDSILWASHVLYGDPRTVYFSTDEAPRLRESVAAPLPEPPTQGNVLPFRSSRTRGAAAAYRMASPTALSAPDRWVSWLAILLPAASIAMMIVLLALTMSNPKGAGYVRVVDGLVPGQDVIRHQLIDHSPIREVH